jgi:hypothetical protein
MSFTETRSSMASFSGAKTAEYQLKYMATEVVDVLENLNNQYLEFLTNDITGIDDAVDYKQWLTNTYYIPSNENAKECLEICLKTTALYGRRIKPWTDAALKCYDNFLLKYIQEDLKQQINPREKKFLKERQVYGHLIKLDDKHKLIGEAFDHIYQLRNTFQHVQMIDESGNRIPKRTSNNKYNQSRDLIFGWFRVALLELNKFIM